jgi:hypothetical protein
MRVMGVRAAQASPRPRERRDDYEPASMEPEFLHGQKLAEAQHVAAPGLPIAFSRPVSRVLCGASRDLARDGHSSGTPVARRFEQPTRTA